MIESIALREQTGARKLDVTNIRNFVLGYFSGIDLNKPGEYRKGTRIIRVACQKLPDGEINRIGVAYQEGVVLKDGSLKPIATHETTTLNEKVIKSRYSYSEVDPTGEDCIVELIEKNSETNDEKNRRKNPHVISIINSKTKFMG
jgi:hypothetical protein